MIVVCKECSRHYDDAQRWTLCPHPELHSWDAREQIQKVKDERAARLESNLKILAEVEKDSAAQNIESAMVGKPHKTPVRKEPYSCEPCLTDQQLERLCVILGIPHFPVSGILISIDCDRIVKVYMSGFVPKGAFDEFLTMLAGLKEKEGE